jgi:hypothetical protein
LLRNARFEPDRKVKNSNESHLPERVFADNYALFASVGTENRKTENRKTENREQRTGTKGPREQGNERLGRVR